MKHAYWMLLAMAATASVGAIAQNGAGTGPPHTIIRPTSIIATPLAISMPGGSQTRAPTPPR